MKRSLWMIFLRKFSKVYFSGVSNKEQRYKQILFHEFRKLGGIYIKFLQTLCLTKNFLEGWGGPREFEIFNKVMKEKINISEYIDLDDFQYIEEEPFACGSFAQVYQGKMKTGEKVAVKILRPSVYKYLRSDLQKLERIVKLISLFLPKNIMDYQSAFSEFKTNCLLETDYKREISNMRYFSKLYHNHPYIVIPKVYSEVCKKNVIVQEFIEGPTLADVIFQVPSSASISSYVKKKMNSDLWLQLMIVGGEFLKTAMTEEYIFGDPHPGNMILLPNDKVAFIDFGIVSRKPSSQEAFYQFVQSYYHILLGSEDYGQLLNSSLFCFCPDLANALKQCSINMGFDYFSSISAAINKKSQIIKKNNYLLSNVVEDGHLFTAFISFFDQNNSLNIQLDGNNFQLLKAMQEFLGLVTSISNRYGEEKFSKIMIGSMRYAFKYCETHKIRKDMSYKTKYNISESYELLLDNLSSLAEKDEFLFNTLCERIFL